jgi:hypothetical protein
MKVHLLHKIMKRIIVPKLRKNKKYNIKKELIIIISLKSRLQMKKN